MLDAAAGGAVPGPPSISVVICAYTHERLPALDEGIGALQGGTLAPHQIVVVIDHAPELLEDCRERWPGVLVIPNQQSRGLCGARNTGVEAIDADVVAFLDDDAVPAPDWIEAMGKAYSDPGVLGVGGPVEPRWLEGRPRWFPPEYDWVVGCTHSGMPRERAPVRNMVGANMSLRRDVVERSGGFRHVLGRVGADGAGGDETDLCIRARHLWPEGEILFDPGVRVEHLVPRARGTLRYFVTRCRGEGYSKAILSRLVGAESGLESERDYVRRTLPLGFLRGLREALGGDLGGLERAAMLATGLAVTSYGYFGTLPRAASLAAAEDGDGEERPLRVLMVTPRNPLGQGGVERHVMEVGRRFAASGMEVEVLCAEPGAPATQEWERDGVRIRAVRAWPADRDYYFAPGLWREMGRGRWDVVHVQSYHTLVAPLAMLRALTLRIPYVVTFHGGGHSSALRNRSRRLQRRLLRPLLARAARLVAVARFEVEQYARELRVPPDRFALIPNGTELSLASPAGAAATPRPPTVASVGRLERYKGHHRVIEAFPEILRERPDARLLIVGSGPYEEELRRQAESLDLDGRVQFTSVPAGDAEAMGALLSGVALVILMSEFETHPIVALEAATAGCRLLVADAGGLAELAAEGVARPVPLEADPATVGRAAVEELAKPPSEQRPNLISWDDTARMLVELYGEVTGIEPLSGAADRAAG